MNSILYVHACKIMLTKTTFDKADLHTHYNVAFTSNLKIVKISKSINVFFFLFFFYYSEQKGCIFYYKILITRIRNISARILLSRQAVDDSTNITRKSIYVSY